MKKIVCIVVFSLFVTFQTAYAHPPSNIHLSYDEYSKTLKINISHPVTNPKSHYIKEVKVLLKGDLVLEHKLSLQETDSTQFLQYSLPDAESGDTVRVEAYCSSFGKRMKELKIR